MSGKAYDVVMGDRGRLVVPAELREAAGIGPGSPLVMLATPAGVVVLTREQARTQLRRQLSGASLVEELVEERRQAARVEDGQ